MNEEGFEKPYASLYKDSDVRRLFGTEVKGCLLNYMNFRRYDRTVDLSRLDQRGLATYEWYLKTYRDWYSVITTAINRGREEGLREAAFEKGYKEGFKEGFEKGYKEGFEIGMEEGFKIGYKEGLEMGIEKGRRMGREEGRKEKREAAKNLKNLGVAVIQIAQALGLTEEEVAGL